MKSTIEFALKRLLFSVVIPALFLLLCVSGLYLVVRLFAETDRPFDRYTWHSDGNSRMSMAEDVKQNYIKTGLSEKAVLYLLGEPASIIDSNSPSAMLKAPNAALYYDYPLDSSSLYLFFDKSHKVLDSTIIPY